MNKRRFLLSIIFAALLLGNWVPPAGGQSIPSRVDGVELSTLEGPFANIYPWEFLPEQSPVHPIPELFTPYERQSPTQIAFQNRLLDSYGFSADVLEYNPNPAIADHNYWLSTYFTNGSRPFFFLYEHIYGTRFRPENGGPKDMSDPYNRKVFLDDIDFMFRNVIMPFRHRYVTVEGRAVIFMWASSGMTGDFPSLLDEARNKYPVFFIGSGEDPGKAERVRAFDGVMEYSLAGFAGPEGDYQMMVSRYFSHSKIWRSVLDDIYQQSGKKIYLIPTFQAAYDDTLVIPRRNNNPVYAKTRGEVVEHARLIKLSMTRWRIFDDVGPFTVFSELPEGASVIPSLRWPEREGRYVGYGTGRIDIVSEFFSRRGPRAEPGLRGGGK